MFEQIDFTDFLVGFVLAALLFFCIYLLVNAKRIRERESLERTWRDRQEDLERHLALLEGQMLEKQNEIERLDADKKSAAGLMKELYEELADWKIKANSWSDKLAFQEQEFSALREQFSSEFKLLSNSILEEKTQKFTEVNHERMSELLDPLKERIRFFEEEMRKTHLKDSEARASMAEQFEQFRKMGVQMSEETRKLTSALKGDNKIGGQWGELILESLLEKSGLMKGREFKTQESFQREGSILRPDVVIYLPENKQIVVDSKLSLKAYEAFVSADDPISKAKALKAHILSLKTHIDGLSAKNYQQLYQLESLDFVLLFMPLEPAFALALQNDPDIFNRAFERNIIIVSPTTLLATLRTIANIWRQENRNRHAMEIAIEGGKLYDKFVAFVEDLEKLGTQMRLSEQAYEKAFNKLTSGRGNLVSKSEKLRKLGARNAKKLPAYLVNDEEHVLEDSQ